MPSRVLPFFCSSVVLPEAGLGAAAAGSDLAGAAATGAAGSDLAGSDLVGAAATGVAATGSDLAGVVTGVAGAVMGAVAPGEGASRIQNNGASQFWLSSLA